MPSWKKVITSGSNAALNTLNVTDGAIISSSLTLSGSINNVDYIDFNTGTPEPTWKSGRVYWNEIDGALSVYNAEADISNQLGQEVWARAWNGTGNTILNGSVVKLIGSHGDAPEIVLAQSTQVSGSVTRDNQILGFATHDIESNSFGYITTQGLVKGLNTSLFLDGDRLYVSSSAGLISKTPPIAPYEIIPVGIVVKSGPGGSGIIYADPYQPMDFSDLSTVESGNYEYGDIFTYAKSGSVGVWRHTNQLSGSYGITGSLQANSFTGSLLGNASTSTTSSYALTSSYSLNAGSISSNITNNVNNYILTATGGSTINGESTLTYNGSQLFVGASSTGEVYAGTYHAGNGTAANPSHTFHTDTTTGMFRNFVDSSLNFSTVGSTKLTILNGGNVGIGITNPTPKLHIYQNDTATGDNSGITIEQDGTGDAILSYLLSGTQRWVTGIDNSDLDKFKIASSIDLNTDARLTIDTLGNVGIGTTSPGAKLDVEGDVLIKAANLSNQENTDVDTGTEVVATVAIATYTAAFFDFVVKNGTNIRSGTVFACHDGTNVEFTETSTADLGTTSPLTLSVDISSGNMRLLATATTDNWSVKTLVRAL